MYLPPSSPVPLPHCTLLHGTVSQVKSLDLSHNELQRLGGLQPFSSLVALDLAHNRLGLLQGLPLGLIRLNVSHNHLPSLDGLSALPYLQDVDASHNRLTDVSSIQRTSSIQSLKLGGNRLGTVRGLEGLPHLHTLELDANYLRCTDDVRPLASCRALRSLSLRANPLTDDTSYRRAVAEALPGLRTLDGGALVALQQAHMQRTGSATPRTPDLKPMATLTSVGTTQQHQQQQQPRTRSPSASARGGGGGGGGGPSTPRTSAAATPPARGRSHSGGPAAAAAATAALSTSTPPPSHHSHHHQHHQHSRTPTAAALHAAAASQRARTPPPQRAGSEQPQQPQPAAGLSFESVKMRGASRRGELSSSNRQLVSNVDELRGLLEEEYQLTTTLQKQKRQTEAELASTKEALGEELASMADLREENARLRGGLQAAQQQNDKLFKMNRHLELRFKEDKERRLQELDRLKTTHNAVVEGLRQKAHGRLADAKAAQDVSARWEEERAKLEDVIRVLEGENSALAVKLSKYENAAADLPYITHDVSDVHRSGLKVHWSPRKSPSAPAVEQVRSHPERAAAAAAAPPQETQQQPQPPPPPPPGVRTTTTTTTTTVAAPRDARRLIELSRSANAALPQAAAAGAQQQPQQQQAGSAAAPGGQEDIAWGAALPPSDVGSAAGSERTEGTKQALDFAVSIKRFLHSEMDKLSPAKQQQQQQQQQHHHHHHHHHAQHQYQQQPSRASSAASTAPLHGQ